MINVKKAAVFSAAFSKVLEILMGIYYNSIRCMKG
jgi:hypothetical protein